MRLSLLFLLALPFTAATAQERIVSQLEVFDIKTNTHRVVRTFDYKIEAPNWTPDGRWFVYNSGGRLFRLSADDPSSDPIEIDTGTADGCNNDHVIAPDGSWIGISDKWPSRVFRVPFGGGEPEEITPIGPSFLHGISPDGREVAYCAFRGDRRAVYAKRIDEDEERCLTDAEGLNDGPEYAPNGRHIWYNSSRTGEMHIWRMRADGSRQKQMTHHENLYSWFPHVSPDGRWVVYICYRKGDVKADEHVPNKNVELRLMTAKGKRDRLLTPLFGGQGTINVNSWAPDSKRFAYVSYKIPE